MRNFMCPYICCSATHQHSTVALSALAFAMYDSGMAGIVRRVYRAKSTPRMGVLIPEYKDDDEGNSKLVSSQCSS